MASALIAGVGVAFVWLPGLTFGAGLGRLLGLLAGRLLSFATVFAVIWTVGLLVSGFSSPAGIALASFGYSATTAMFAGKDILSGRTISEVSMVAAAAALVLFMCTSAASIWYQLQGFTALLFPDSQAWSLRTVIFVRYWVWHFAAGGALYWFFRSDSTTRSEIGRESPGLRVGDWLDSTPVRALGLIGTLASIVALFLD